MIRPRLLSHTADQLGFCVTISLDYEQDVRQAPHYALGAIPLGYVVGVAATGALPDDVPLSGLALAVGF